MIIRMQNLNKEKAAYASWVLLLPPEACKGKKGVSLGTSLTPETPAALGEDHLLMFLIKRYSQSNSSLIPGF